MAGIGRPIANLARWLTRRRADAVFAPDRPCISMVTVTIYESGQIESTADMVPGLEHYTAQVLDAIAADMMGPRQTERMH